MKTIKSLLIIPFLCMATLAYGQWDWGNGKGVKGNGNMTTDTRNVGDYDAIKCAGFMDFKLVQGSEGTIKVEAESNLQEYIITEVKNGALSIRVKTGKNLKPSKNKMIVITIPYESVNKVSLSGSGDVWNEGTIKASNLNVSLSGSGDIILNVEATDLKGSVSGSGDLTLKGSATNLDANVTGSGDFHGFDLNSVNTDASVTGSGDADVRVSGNFKARVTGSGDIEYRGTPTKEDIKVIGSGSVEN
ncbi:head GIN domain-containing protein [Winogradskyella maritima]|uniref:Head GIN domain-containing protein n=1 Tax=Winogradskyella maritima TaxID=1517766 RepID=A0ABV8AIM1_9FLAO|nr:head GIN domain-containing protein [Winogradskyella maritima]